MNTIHTNNGTLKYDVMIEHSNGNGYTARLLAWPDTIVQASTREKVLQEMRMLLLDRLAKAEIVTLEIQPTEIDHSWAPFAGMWADIPDLEEFRAEIERNRRELDAIHAPWMLEDETNPESQPDQEMVAA